MPDNNKIPWYKQKTTWTAAGAVLAAIAGYFSGGLELWAAITGVFLAVSQIFQRQGIEKAKP